MQTDTKYNWNHDYTQKWNLDLCKRITTTSTQLHSHTITQQLIM